jgi:serine/threonine protein phosphatase PrpC
MRKIESKLKTTETEIQFYPSVIHQNVIKSYNVQTRQGKLSDNTQKMNQDNSISLTSLNNSKTQHLFAIMDGHGYCGRQCSLLAKSKFSKYVSDGISKSLLRESIESDFNLNNNDS